MVTIQGTIFSSSPGSCRQVYGGESVRPGRSCRGIIEVMFISMTWVMFAVLLMFILMHTSLACKLHLSSSQSSSYWPERAGSLSFSQSIQWPERGRRGGHNILMSLLYGGVNGQFQHLLVHILPIRGRRRPREIVNIRLIWSADGLFSHSNQFDNWTNRVENNPIKKRLMNWSSTCNIWTFLSCPV